MFKWILFFLLPFQSSYGLMSLEGILLGEVDPKNQYDPLLGILNKKISLDSNDISERLYRGLYQQGIGLKLSCELDKNIEYNSIQDEVVAKRSIVSTLQYIILDLSLKAIASYSKKLEFNPNQYKKMYQNLIKSSCHPNTTVYGKKLLADNFKYYWVYPNDSNYKLPSLSSSKIFSKQIKRRQAQKKVLTRELNYTLRNFRAFCSWNGDVDNYALLAPYIQDPFIMSHVYNNLVKRKLSFDPKTEEITLAPAKETAQIYCNNLICRRTSKTNFNKRFPRMLGSTSLESDLSRLYCAHFKNQTYNFNNPVKAYRDWLSTYTDIDALLEKGQALTLISGVPDIIFSLNKFTDIDQSLKKNIDDFWRGWAFSKIKNLEYNIFYEDALKIELVETDQDKIIQGDFAINMHITLGEMDLMLDSRDKISSVFSLKFPVSLLAKHRDQLNYFYRKGEYKAASEEIKSFEKQIELRMKKMALLFKTPLWNEKIYPILQKEIYSQLNQYRGNKIQVFDQSTLSIPVKFHYGVFALKYIYDKHTEKKQREKILTFTK